MLLEKEDLVNKEFLDNLINNNNLVFLATMEIIILELIIIKALIIILELVIIKELIIITRWVILYSNSNNSPMRSHNFLLQIKIIINMFREIRNQILINSLEILWEEDLDNLTRISIKIRPRIKIKIRIIY